MHFHLSPSVNTGLFKMIVRVLTTCHTQCISDSIICIFLFNRTTLPVFVTYVTGALYVHPLWFYKHQHENRVHSKLFVACKRGWFQWHFWFVPSVPGYLQEEEEHKPDPWCNFLIHQCNYVLLSKVYCVWQVVKTPTFILNNTVYRLLGCDMVLPATCWESFAAAELKIEIWCSADPNHRVTVVPVGEN